MTARTPDVPPVTCLPRRAGLAMAAAALLAAAPAMAAQDEPGCLDQRLSATLIRLQPKGSHLTAVIAPTLGGQLVGLQLRRAGKSHELLYRGMDFCPQPGFAGKAMVMWPATGRTFAADPSQGKADKAAGWQWQGKLWPMPIHGFAKNGAWSVVTPPKGASVTIALRDTPESRALFPFPFRLSITYALRGERISVTHQVTNPGDVAMPFSIGNHITFALPLGGQGDAADARISTNGRGRLLLDAYGRPAGTGAVGPLKSAPLSSLGTETAVPLLWSGFRGRPTVTLTQPGVGSIMIMQQSRRPAERDVVAFNLWGNVEKGFFSPEPWYGRQNALSDGGVVLLPPGQSFTWAFSADIRL
ncbi:aldose 1-epimerase [Sphingobium xenophagum]|uniref:Aldose 1-epimerase n=1 Tax=Sphingobium xenophagum TaxID=121428 RepID=A0A401IXW8_SPHXE|nr:hypothetical protein [Sphingobium xenophagum]GBH29254.1 hypothetical protein MBESOW_P0507 [Sphingobium xenophagum]